MPSRVSLVIHLIKQRSDSLIFTTNKILPFRFNDVLLSWVYCDIITDQESKYSHQVVNETVKREKDKADNLTASRKNLRGKLLNKKQSFSLARPLFFRLHSSEKRKCRKKMKIKFLRDNMTVCKFEVLLMNNFFFVFRRQKSETV